MILEKSLKISSILNSIDHKTLFDNNPSPMWVYDLDTFKFLAVNNSAIHSYGYSREEFLSMTLNDIRPVEDTTILKAHILINDEEIQKSIYWRHKKKDGSIIYVDILSHALPSLEKLHARLVMALDVTDRKLAKDKLQEKEKEYRNLFENALVGIYRTTPEGKVLNANPALIKMLGYSSLEELTTIELDKEGFAPDSPRSKFIALMNEFGEVKNFEFIWKKKDNSIIYILENAKAIKDKNGKTIYFEGSVQDITDLKLAEIELVKAKEKAEEADKLKSIFLSNMSHELLTPLNGLLGGVQLLEDELKDSSNFDLVQAVISGSKRLAETLNSILELSRLESNKFNINNQPVNIIELLNEIVNLNGPSAVSKNLYLNFHQNNSEIFINGDKHFLFTIFNNLIKNAVKYTVNGGITVKIEPPDSLKIKISVSDTGIGISNDNNKIIFEPFRQVSEGLTRNFEGPGIGLTITKKFVELLNGTIHLESEEGKGSKFSITLPIS